MLRAALLSLLLTAPALAQDIRPDLPPLDPALTGTWEMVEKNVPGADVDVVEMTLTFDGNASTVVRTVRIDGELREETITSECRSVDDMVQCVSTGDNGGKHSGWGRPEITGDTLRFTVPKFGGYYAVFQRVRE